ncbi:MAG: isoleucine--tRNA ligase [Candidatus Levyibacteriota bacterium]
MFKSFKPVSPKVDFVKQEEEILKFWKENKIFEKSVESRPENKPWIFLDGPPFITGLPHYGTLLSSIPKDLFPRFKTMQGYRVRRVWGWDCHGLPAENKVEEKLGIKRKKDIEEKVGVKKFINECKLYVKNVSKDWEWYVDRIGRWADFENAYKTMDISYMESVMWVFKQMYDKGLVYKGLRVSLFCPHCSTPISNFEVAMDADNYKDLTEPTAVYKYRLKAEKNTYLLAWSTTPWNKLVTSSLAVKPDLTYVKVCQGKENYILAKSTVKMLEEKPYKILEEFKGSELVGKEFIPPYDFYKIDPGKKAFIVIGADFVTEEEGTGVVTLAPYGEEDLEVMQKENIQIVLHVDEEGIVKDFVPKFGGMYYLKADKLVLEDLKERGVVYRLIEHTHSVPHCWRCETRLFYAPQNAWYVNIQTLKSQLKKTNETINWFPKHFKYGRFLKSMEQAPDWCISRSRYWGSPVPVWECFGCGQNFVPDSIKELEEASGKKINDLHKPEIDEITVKCKKCGKVSHRVPEVLDSWIEAGSAPYAERHFPFVKGLKLEDFFPPDFIVEYTGQIRAWFYVLHVIGTAIFNSKAFKNVSVTGVILGTDGRKMSKNYNNYPDPKQMLQKYGGDALRLYLMGSPVMKGEDILISEDHYREQVKGTMLILWNIYNFFVMNASVDKWSVTSCKLQVTSQNVLDKWINARLNETIREVTNSLENFDTVSAIKFSEVFISDLSLWYVRRSRSRVGMAASNKEDKNACYQTFYRVLVTFSKLIAPITPFIAEEFFRNLTGEESVHLTEWPENSLSIDKKLIEEMAMVRKIVEMGHSTRKSNNIKVRQPLSKFSIFNLKFLIDEGLVNLVKDELNVKEVIQKEGKGDLLVEFDTKLTKELIDEGQMRDIVRKIQEERKRLETKPDEKVNVVLQDWPKDFEEEIKKRAQANKLSKGEKFEVKRE